MSDYSTAEGAGEALNFAPLAKLAQGAPEEPAHKSLEAAQNFFDAGDRKSVV